MAEEKNPLISALASFIIPGAGQVVNGETKKGVVIFLGYCALWVVCAVVYTIGTIVTGGIGGLLCLPVFLVPMILWAFGVYDAYMAAQGKPVWNFQ